MEFQELFVPTISYARDGFPITETIAYYLELSSKKFKDYPNFLPNLTPQEIFSMGSFGGTYWRPIKNDNTLEVYKDIHLQYPKEWWKDLEDKHLTSKFKDYDKSLEQKTKQKKLFLPHDLQEQIPNNVNRHFDVCCLPS